MGDLRIAIGWARGRPTFDLTTPHGGAPRVTSIAVFDAERQTHCWLVSPGARGGANTTGQLRQKFHEAGYELPDGLDPIEDLSPLDPRYRIAERHLLDVVDESQPELRHFTYGEIPPGFHQLLPFKTGAAPLKSGQRYELVVSGVADDDLTTESFVAP